MSGPYRHHRDGENDEGQPRTGPAFFRTKIGFQHCFCFHVYPILFVDRAFRIEGVEREGKGHVMDRVHQLAIFLALYRYVADIPALRDVALVHGRVLTRFLGDHQIICLDPLCLAEKLDRPGLILDRNDIVERANILRETAPIEERSR